MKKQFLLISLMSFITIMALLTNIQTVMSQSDFDTTVGSFRLDAKPNIYNMEFVNDTYSPTLFIDPDATTYFRLNFTLRSLGTLADLKNATLYIFDDSVHGSDWQTASPDGVFLVVFQWVEATDTWSVVNQGALSQWSVDNVNSDDAGSGSSLIDYEFSLRFTASKAARYDTDWNATGIVYDDDNDWKANSVSTLVTMNKHYELNFNTATFSWGEVEPNTFNNTHTSLQLTVLGNAQWEIRINATDFNSTVDIDANNILTWDLDGSEGGNSFYIRNSLATCLGTWDNQAPMSTEAGFTRNVYIFLNTGSFFTLGNYWETTIMCWLQSDV